VEDGEIHSVRFSDCPPTPPLSDETPESESEMEIKAEPEHILHRLQRIDTDAEMGVEQEIPWTRSHSGDESRSRLKRRNSCSSPGQPAAKRQRVCL